MRSTLSLLLTGLFAALATAAVCPPSEMSNTGPFTIMALNSSYPFVDHLFVWTQSGINYLDRGVQNPRYSYPVTAKLENNKLIRIPESGDPGAALTIANLNFGTSNVCCNYAQLKWSSPDNIPLPARTTPFYIDRRGMLVWEQAPYRQPWYVCGKTKLPGTKGEERVLYLGLPFYDSGFENKPEEYCVAVELAIVRPLESGPA